MMMGGLLYVEGWLCCMMKGGVLYDGGSLPYGEE